MPEFVVSLTWDEEAGVWVATSDDVPGLVLESGSLDALIEQSRYAIPELLLLNMPPDGELSICYRSERHERIAV